VCRVWRQQPGGVPVAVRRRLLRCVLCPARRDRRARRKTRGQPQHSTREQTSRAGRGKTEQNREAGREDRRRSAASVADPGPDATRLTAVDLLPSVAVAQRAIDSFQRLEQQQHNSTAVHDERIQKSHRPGNVACVSVLAYRTRFLWRQQVLASILLADRCNCFFCRRQHGSPSRCAQHVLRRV
jgi:hypothetical protein